LRRAKLSLLVTFALALCVAGSVAAENIVVNGQFNEPLAGSWQAWASPVGNFGNTYWTDPKYVSVTTTQDANIKETTEIGRAHV
jgi:hypothetical protein